MRTRKYTDEVLSLIPVGSGEWGNAAAHGVTGPHTRTGPARSQERVLGMRRPKPIDPLDEMTDLIALMFSDVDVFEMSPLAREVFKRNLTRMKLLKARVAMEME